MKTNVAYEISKMRSGVRLLVAATALLLSTSALSITWFGSHVQAYASTPPMLSIDVPAGLTLEQIGKIFERAGLLEADELVARVHDPELIEALGLEVLSLEGYLKPDVYELPLTAAVDDILGEMVFRQRQELATIERHMLAAALDLDTHQVLSLASMLELETRSYVERTLISRIWLARVRSGMAIDSPYNPSLGSGIPHRPVCNPGLTTIDAVLQARSTPYAVTMTGVGAPDRT